jgi:protein dithiol:quinone oxidoreductase
VKGPSSRARRPLAAIAVVSFGAVAAALVSQHAFGMDPCPWCILQRLIFVATGVAALLGLAWRSAGLILVTALTGCGVAAALWQHFVAAASSSCNLTLADRIVSGLQLDAMLPFVFEVRASCADAAVNLAGLPYEFWSLGLFTAIGAAALGLLLSGRGVQAA